MAGMDSAVVREYNAVKATREGREPAMDPVMVEATVDLMVNGARLSSIVTTAEMQEELVVGYLITEGAVRSMDDIQGIEATANRVNVAIKDFERFGMWYELRSSGCIGINWAGRDDDRFLQVDQRFSVDVILDSLKYLYSEVHERTRGAHMACLVDERGDVKHFALDVGRHNAIDKVVGAAALAGRDVSRLFLVSSGRQPAGMVLKAARAGIPVIVSKAAPISSGIDSARLTNVTLCCFADWEKVKIFSCPERIV